MTIKTRLSSVETKVMRARGLAERYKNFISSLAQAYTKNVSIDKLMQDIVDISHMREESISVTEDAELSGYLNITYGVNTPENPLTDYYSVIDLSDALMFDIMTAIPKDASGRVLGIYIDQYGIRTYDTLQPADLKAARDNIQLIIGLFD